MRREGLKPSYLDRVAPIRVNLVTDGDGPARKYNHPGHPLGAAALRAYGRGLRRLRRGDLWVLTGRVPPGVPEGLPARWVRDLERRGVRCAVDASGRPLAALLKARPSFVKVNLFELGEALGRGSGSLEDLLDVLPALHRRGLRHGAVTDGAQGVLAWEGPEVVRAAPPRLPRTTAPVVGAGDAFLAGYLRAWRMGLDLRGRVRSACGAGAAVAERGVLGFDPRRAEALSRKTRILEGF
jgi:1-phosphofructokinase